MKSLAFFAAALAFVTIPAWPLWAMGVLAVVLWSIVAGIGLNVHDLKRTLPRE